MSCIYPDFKYSTGEKNGATTFVLLYQSSPVSLECSFGEQTISSSFRRPLTTEQGAIQRL